MHEQDKAILRSIVTGLIDPAGWWIVDGDYERVPGETT